VFSELQSTIKRLGPKKAKKEELVGGMFTLIESPALQISDILGLLTDGINYDTMLSLYRLIEMVCTYMYLKR
jgi:hypothetical protein